MSEDAAWHYSVGGQVHGPVTTGELRRLVKSGELAEGDLVWKEGMAEWQPATRVKGLFPEMPRSGPPDLPTNNRKVQAALVRVDAPLPDEQAFASKKTPAAVLAILLGMFSIHKFILGLSKPGGIMLGLSLVGLLGGCAGFFCFFTLPMFIIPAVTSVIGIVEGVIYLQKSDAEFYQLYAVEKKDWF